MFERNLWKKVLATLIVMGLAVAIAPALVLAEEADGQPPVAETGEEISELAGTEELEATTDVKTYQLPEGAVDLGQSEGIASPEGFEDESEMTAMAGNSMGNATSISLNSRYSGSITSSNEKDFYKFTLSSSGRVDFSVSAGIKWLYFYLYDSDGNQVWNKNKQWNSTTEKIDFTEPLHLTKGTYYLAFQKDGSNYGNYEFRLGFTSASESFSETQGGSNNSMAKASSASLDTKYNGQIALDDEKDFYKFTLSSSGRVDFSVSAGIKWLYFYLYDSDGNQVWNKNKQWNSTTEKIDFTEPLHLTKGTYYLAFQKDGSNYGNYEFRLDFVSADESFSETQGGSNNLMSVANSVTLGTKYYGQIAINDEKDFYKFTTSDKSGVNLSVKAAFHWVYLYVYDSSGNQVWNANPSWNSSTETIDQTYYVSVGKGTYYLALVRDGSYAGNYSFKIAGYTAPTWSGASKLPTNATATYTVKNGSIGVKYGSYYISVSGKKVTAKHAGTATLALYDSAGKEYATKEITVYDLSGNYVIQSVVDSDYVLDIRGKSKENSARMIVWKRNGGNNQKYQFVAQSDGTYMIKCVHSGKYVDVQGGGTKKSQPVIQYSYNGKDNQRWKITVDAKNRLTFVCKKSGMAFDIQGGKVTNRAQMIQYPINGGNNQKWVLKRK